MQEDSPVVALLERLDVDTVLFTDSVIDLMEDPELPRRPTQESASVKDFVREAPAPKELLSDNDNEKRFASQHEQNVIEEQQARKSGMTANRSYAPAAPDAGVNRKTANKKKFDFKPTSAIERLSEANGDTAGDIIASGLKPTNEKGSSTDGRPLDFSRFGSIERGISTISERVPADVRIGDFTALNTDRHLFYTFYSRIEDMIRSRWVNYVKATMYGMETGVVVIPNGQEWTTKLEIVLDRTGSFSKAILHDSSGSRNLDSAPVQAFRDAHQFPNPPVEMIKEDGTIRLMYAFSVVPLPSYAADQAE